MKRILALVCVVFFVASSPSVYAASDELPDDVFNQVEYQELCDICEKEFEYLDGEYSRGTLAGGYRYYLMDPGVFECLIDSEVPLIHLVSGSMPYAWVILGGNDTIFDFRYSELEDDWILVGETFYEGSQQIFTNTGISEPCGLMSSDIVLQQMKTIENQGECITEKGICFVLKQISVTITLYAFRTDVDTYLIPFSWRPDLTGLESGKCYKAKEAISVLMKNYPVKYADDTQGEGEALAGGGQAVSEYKRADFRGVTDWPIIEEQEAEATICETKHSTEGRSTTETVVEPASENVTENMKNTTVDVSEESGKEVTKQTKTNKDIIVIVGFIVVVIMLCAFIGRAIR